MIDWVFLDVGNVLFNDDPQNFEGYRLLFDTVRIRHPSYSFDAMMAEREERARAGENFILSTIARRMLPEEDAKFSLRNIRELLIGSYDRHNLWNERHRAVLDQLRRHWRLGIIANQPPECRNSLARRGLLDYFDVVAISDERHLHKPDLGLFEWALGQAGCDPARTVMIGDRRDNDIDPANRSSMRTILYRWPDCRSKGWNPDNPLAQAFLDSCDRVALFSAVPVGAEPDLTIASLEEAPAAVAELTRK
ncbi:MAG TPA: HAD family hydrolase [Planctomycetaceae bacterium]|nr:HAD family hydrolase [Planctomycetaceae bacterium]